MYIRAAAIVAVSMSYIVAVPCAARGLPQSPVPIRYVSADLKHFMIFSQHTALIGTLSGFNPFAASSYSVKEVKAAGAVQCISVGLAGSSAQFAIKRPIKLGERYSCLRTVFRISRCFDSCQAAIIEVDRPLTGPAGGIRKAYLYIDSCVGLLGSSEVSDMTNGISLDALWLRGNVGVLASPDYPRCPRLM